MNSDNERRMNVMYSLHSFQETLNLMKAEGWKFPAVREAEAMFEADTAPEWAEGDVCNRCR